MKPIIKTTDAWPDFPSSWRNFFKDDTWENSWISKVPAANVLEGDENFTLELAAPGLTKEDFTIDIDQGYLRISSKQEHKQETEEDNYTRKEFSYQSFQRSFMIPDNVDLEGINAQYQDGLLKVILPKLETLPPAEKKQIKIK